MSQIIKDKHGKVVSTSPDTRYHEDGTGPRDANGVPILQTEAEAHAVGPDPQTVADLKKNHITSTTTNAAAKTATAARED